VWAPPGNELEQQLMQLRDHPGVIFAQRPAAVGQDPQHRQLLIIGDPAQARHPGSGQRDRMRAGRICFTALPGGEYPGAGRQLRRHVHHVLTIGQQPAGDVPANALAALDRPGPLRPPLHPRQHGPVPGRVRPIPASAHDGLVACHDLDRGRPLVRIHPDDHLAHPSSSVVLSSAEQGGHRYFELNRPLLSLSPLIAAPGPRRPNESHTTSAGSRNESDEPGT
jgi:hypothetical protein